MTPKNRKRLRAAGRIVLGSFLVGAGIGHLTFARRGFRVQVPDFVPLKKDDTVVYSGYAEIALGLALMAAPEKARGMVGKVAAGFFAAVFPGNLAQYANHRDGLGLDTDRKRFARLFFQPLLILAALKTTEVGSTKSARKKS